MFSITVRVLLLSSVIFKVLINRRVLATLLVGFFLNLFASLLEIKMCSDYLTTTAQHQPGMENCNSELECFTRFTRSHVFIPFSMLLPAVQKWCFLFEFFKFSNQKKVFQPSVVIFWNKYIW